jgi:hypothetical protein
MNTTQRAGYWNERTRLPGHQRAYDLTAQKIPLDSPAVIDTGCANAELLKRLYLSNPDRMLIGTDNSYESLQHARENLSSSGIGFEESDPRNVYRSHRGITLCMDDYRRSKIPAGMASAVISMFADAVKPDFQPSSGDYSDLRLFEETTRQTIPEGKEDIMNIMRMMRQTARLLQNDGLFVLTNYDANSSVLPNDDSTRLGLGLQYGLVGLILESTKFFDDEEVFSTIGEQLLITGDIKGFRISTFRKRKK